MKRTIAVACVVALAWSCQVENRPGWLGLGVAPQVDAGDPIGRSTLVVQRLAVDGPAAKAGIRPGDVIRAVDGRSMTFADDLEMLAWFAKIRPSQQLSLTVERRGKLMQIVIGATRMNDEQYALWQKNQRLAHSQAR